MEKEEPCIYLEKDDNHPEHIFELREEEEKNNDNNAIDFDNIIDNF